MRVVVFDDSNTEMIDYDFSSLEPIMRMKILDKDQIVEILDILDITMEELEDALNTEEECTAKEEM